LAIFLRERKPKDLSELASLAEQYLYAHANSKKEWPRKPMFRGHMSPTSERLEAVAEVRELLNRK